MGTMKQATSKKRLAAQNMAGDTPCRMAHEGQATQRRPEAEAMQAHSK